MNNQFDETDHRRDGRGKFANKQHDAPQQSLTLTDEPDFAEPEPARNLADPADYYPDRQGSKYTGWRPSNEIAKDVRADIKEAVAAGWLPAEANGQKLAYSVRSDKFSGGQSIDVTIKGAPDDFVYESDDSFARSDDSKELIRRVDMLAGAYNRSRTEIMTDYFDETYYSNTSIEDEGSAISSRGEKLRTKGRSELRKAIKNGATPSEQREMAAEANEKYAAIRDEYQAHRDRHNRRSW